jgi:hypothetical protein
VLLWFDIEEDGCGLRFFFTVKTKYGWGKLEIVVLKF